MEAINGGLMGEEKGAPPPPPSPLTGCYLLVVIGEPHSPEHKDIILQKVAKGLLSWNVNDCLVDLEKELAIIIEQGLEGEEARYGERLIQFASENLVTEILIHPAVSTLSQCIRNLLSSFTRHRHIIHAGYTFQGNGSWALQDGTFSYSDFSEAFQEIEVQRVIHAYENGISIDLHCSPEGEWTRLPKEYFTKSCKVRVNPTDVLTTGSPSITSFIKYLEPFLVPTVLEDILESSDVVGNIRFSRPTLYVFPGGQGDAALFGINGFNMLLDGGYSRKACFWDFVRHLDRLDAVLMTRLNNSNVSGISSVLKRKQQGAVYPQVGHFFCNIQERKSLLSPDGDKDRDPLIISLLEEGQSIIQDVKHLNLASQTCFRDSEPIILYHKVGHGTLNMYVLSPDKNSREVREFMQKWNQSDPKLFAPSRSGKEFAFPLQNLVSICALLVWQPANPNDTITRILYPGSAPQKKILEGLDRIKGLECMKQPVCTVRSIMPVKKSKQDILEKIAAKEISSKHIIAEKKSENKEEKHEMNGDAVREKTVKKSDSVESDKEKRVKKIEESKKVEENGKVVENGDKVKLKPRVDHKPRVRTESQQRKKPTTVDKKGPPTPKKTVEEKTNGETKEREKRSTHKLSPQSTPAKSTKDANNRKVIESKKTPPKKEPVSKSTTAEKPKPKPERQPISRRPKAVKGPPSPMKKMANGVQKPDSLTKRGKLDKEGTTDSSTVSTPSAEQESILKKDISKLTPEELQQLKEKELEELNEEQEAVKEIEAVFRKGEVHAEESEPGVRKIKEISIEDNLETEEYLIIEKEEVEHDSLDQENKEDEMQKMTRDSEESEKQRKLSAEEIKVEEQKIVKEEPKVEEADSKKRITSPEDKMASSLEKKDLIAEEEVKEIVESHPEEKVSANIESGATTTAPTLPEDERITLDEIKEDNGQPIEEKHVKEETKEKEVPIIQLPPKSQQESQPKPPQTVPGGIPGLDKQKHIRDIVKTPDEVADLPVHEEADYQEFQEDKKSNEVEKKDTEPAKKEEVVSEKAATETRKTDDKKDEEPKPVDPKEAVIGPSEKTDDNKVGKLEVLEKADVETKEKPDQDNNVLLQEDADDEWVVITKEDEDKKAEELKSSIEAKEEASESSSDHEVRQEDEIHETIEKDKEDIHALIEEADQKPIGKEVDEAKAEKVVEVLKELEAPIKNEEKVAAIKESKQDMEAIEDKLQELKKETSLPVADVDLSKPKQDLTKIDEPQVDLKEEFNALTKIDDKLTELKSKGEDEEIIIKKSTRSPEHAEPVVLPDSSPEEDGPRSPFKELEFDKSELGRKSPAEREEDVKKIVASVAVVLKSEEPLETFQGKLTFTQELRETHITTQDSPILEVKIIKTDDIPPIPEEATEEDIHDSEIRPLKVSPDSADKEDDAGTVHRMLVTASSEDGGEEIEICPPGTITFSKSSESSGRSSPEHSQKTQSQKSSIVETLSDTMSTVKQLAERTGQLIESEVDKKIEDLERQVVRSDEGAKADIKEKAAEESQLKSIKMELEEVPKVEDKAAKEEEETHKIEAAEIKTKESVKEVKDLPEEKHEKEGETEKPEISNKDLNLGKTTAKESKDEEKADAKDLSIAHDLVIGLKESKTVDIEKDIVSKSEDLNKEAKVQDDKTLESNLEEATGQPDSDKGKKDISSEDAKELQEAKPDFKEESKKSDGDTKLEHEGKDFKDSKELQDKGAHSIPDKEQPKQADDKPEAKDDNKPEDHKKTPGASKELQDQVPDSIPDKAQPKQADDKPEVKDENKPEDHKKTPDASKELQDKVPDSIPDKEQPKQSDDKLQVKDDNKPEDHKKTPDASKELQDQVPDSITDKEQPKQSDDKPEVKDDNKLEDHKKSPDALKDQPKEDELTSASPVMKEYDSKQLLNLADELPKELEISDDKKQEESLKTKETIDAETITKEADKHQDTKPAADEKPLKEAEKKDSNKDTSNKMNGHLEMKPCLSHQDLPEDTKLTAEEINETPILGKEVFDVQASKDTIVDTTELAKHEKEEESLKHATEQTSNIDSKDTKEHRRESIVDKAEDFIEKTEEAFENVFSSISSKAHSLLDGFLHHDSDDIGETVTLEKQAAEEAADKIADIKAEIDAKATEALSVAKDKAKEAYDSVETKTYKVSKDVADNIGDITDDSAEVAKKTENIDDLKAKSDEAAKDMIKEATEVVDHLKTEAETEIPDKIEHAIEMDLEKISDKATSDKESKEVPDTHRRDSIINKAEEFIEKTEETFESVISSISSKAHSILDGFVHHDSDDTKAPSESSPHLLEENQIEFSASTPGPTKIKADLKDSGKSSPQPEDKSLIKEKEDDLKGRRGSIIEAAAEFIEKSEKALESVFTSIGENVQTVQHDVLPEKDDIKIDETISVAAEKDKTESIAEKSVNLIESALTAVEEATLSVLHDILPQDDENETNKTGKDLVSKESLKTDKDLPIQDAKVDETLKDKDTVKDVDQKEEERVAKEKLGDKDNQIDQIIDKPIDSKQHLEAVPHEPTKTEISDKKDEQMVKDIPDVSMCEEKTKSDIKETAATKVNKEKEEYLGSQDYKEKDTKAETSNLDETKLELSTDQPIKPQEEAHKVSKASEGLTAEDKKETVLEKSNDSKEALSVQLETPKDALKHEDTKTETTISVDDEKTKPLAGELKKVDEKDDGISKGLTAEEKLETKTTKSSDKKDSSSVNLEGSKDIDAKSDKLTNLEDAKLDLSKHAEDDSHKVDKLDGVNKESVAEDKKEMIETLSKDSQNILSAALESSKDLPKHEDTKAETTTSVDNLKLDIGKDDTIKPLREEEIKVTDKLDGASKDSAVEDKKEIIETEAKDIKDTSSETLDSSKDPPKQENIETKKATLLQDAKLELMRDLPDPKMPEEESYKVGKDTLEKDNKQIEAEVKQLGQSVDKLSSLTQSIYFEKCHPTDDHTEKLDASRDNKSVGQVPYKDSEEEYKVPKDTLRKEEKEIEKEVEQVMQNVQNLSQIAQSFSIDKCHAEESKVDKDVTEKEKSNLEDTFEVSKETIRKEEQQIEDEVSHLKRSYDDLAKLTEQVTFDKCKTTDDFKLEKEIQEKEERHFGEEAEALRRSYEDLTKINEEVIFDKCHPDFKESAKVKKEELEKLKESETSKADKDSMEKEKPSPTEPAATKEDKVDSNKADHLAHMTESSKKLETYEMKKPSALSSEVTKVETKDSHIDDKPVPSQAEKCEKERMEKTQTEAEPSKLQVVSPEPKKLSISDVEISLKTELKDTDVIQSFLDNEKAFVCDNTDAKVFVAPSEGDVCERDESSKVEVKESTETEPSSNKSSPEVELSGKVTPPTVPLSPINKDLRSPSLKLDSGMSEQTETDEDDLSTKSQIAHSQSDLDELDMKMDPMSMSFYGALPEEQFQDEGEVPATYLYEITKAKFSSPVKTAKGDVGRVVEEECVMTASFIGDLPTSSTGPKPSSDDSKDSKDAVDSWGKPLGLPAPTYLYEVTKAKFSSHAEEVDVMTSSFIGDNLPSSSRGHEDPMTTSVYFGSDDDPSWGKPSDLTSSLRREEDPMTTSVYFGKEEEDPIASWGKPLGLPSPAPPNNNDKGTPKKERKLPAHVTAKNKLNDDRKRAESPSKLKSKKVNAVYVDLTYVPHHGNHYYSYVDFFKRIRARYYVFSGLEPSRQVYDALLEAKQTWDDKELEVTIIPTYDTDILGYWVAENEELLSKFKIDLAPSASRCTINLQDHETSCSAYRLEF